MPHSRPMPGIGAGSHELRIRDSSTSWRIIYRIDADAIVVADIFAKKSDQTPPQIMKNCKSRLSAYDEEVRKEEQEREDGL
jgi:phage-related protein